MPARHPPPPRARHHALRTWGAVSALALLAFVIEVEALDPAAPQSAGPLAPLFK